MRGHVFHRLALRRPPTERLLFLVLVRAKRHKRAPVCHQQAISASEQGLPSRISQIARCAFGAGLQSRSLIWLPGRRVQLSSRLRKQGHPSKEVGGASAGPWQRSRWLYGPLTLSGGPPIGSGGGSAGSNESSAGSSGSSAGPNQSSAGSNQGSAGANETSARSNRDSAVPGGRAAGSNQSSAGHGGSSAASKQPSAGLNESSAAPVGVEDMSRERLAVRGRVKYRLEHNDLMAWDVGSRAAPEIDVIAVLSQLVRRWASVARSAWANQHLVDHASRRSTASATRLT